MAYQTPYADIPLNTRAIANYNNPIFDVLRNGLGWLENQEQKIADRKKFELLKQIQDDAMTDKYTQAKNANEDLAKQLYGDSYFVDSSDADLAKAMEALKIRESNKMLDTLGRDIASKVNQDIYKAGNEQELLSSLGFNNRTQDELNKVKDFAQDKLRERYRPYIQGKLADREIDEGKVSEQDIDALVGEFRDKYGMDLDPSTLYDPANRKELRQGGINKRIGLVFKQLANKQVTPEDAINYFYLTQAMNPDNSVIIDNAIKSATDMRTRSFKQGATDLLQELAIDAKRDYGDSIDYNRLRSVYLREANDLGIPTDVAMQVYNAYVLKDGSLNSQYYTYKTNRDKALAYKQQLENSDWYKKFDAASKSVPKYTGEHRSIDSVRSKFETIAKEYGLKSTEFPDFMTYLASIDIDPTQIEGENRFNLTIRKAISSYKKTIFTWKEADADYKKKDLLFNNIPMIGDVFSN